MVRRASASPLGNAERGSARRRDGANKNASASGTLAAQSSSPARAQAGDAPSSSKNGERLLLRRDVLDQLRHAKALRKGWRDRIRTLTASSKRLSGKTCILEYLKLFVGRDVRTAELMIVSGIADYGRRIRELRVEQGYDIVSGSPDSEIRVGYYRLYSIEPNEARAHAWRTANHIRRTHGADKDRILKLLQENIDVPLTHDMLQYVGKGKSTRERLRDLRLNDGWRIATRRTGRPDLRNDEYLLINLEQLPPHDRTIPAETYEAVLERDRRRCKRCNWQPKARFYGGKRHGLEVHHKMSFASGGDHRMGNLITLCDFDHDVVHRARIEGHAALAAWLAIKPQHYVKA